MSDRTLSLPKTIELLKRGGELRIHWQDGRTLGLTVVDWTGSDPFVRAEAIQTRYYVPDVDLYRGRIDLLDLAAARVLGQLQDTAAKVRAAREKRAEGE